MQLVAFAFGYPTERDRSLWGLSDEIRWAAILVGAKVSLSNGREIGPYYWRKWELPQEQANEMAWAVMKNQNIPAHNFRAFTLFWNGSKIDKDGNKIAPGFQMSVQMKDDKGGWSIRRITEEQADLIFQHIRYIPSPSGPWELTADIRSDLRDSFIVTHSEANNWQKTTRVVRTETEYFEAEGNLDDLVALLAASAEAVRANKEARATLVAGKL